VAADWNSRSEHSRDVSVGGTGKRGQRDWLGYGDYVDEVVEEIALAIEGDGASHAG